ncbi:putative chromo' (CHRromatin Organization MOdifier) domain protein [Trichinella spiralis]|uniref:putative chromo' (CHRromatin Organization MOdifier) domain protein n=1 Tax=Trichinella spiralis TaxID=6334 RepID=UPI0001EFE924|nr:putative chromo' (CHRromatin Organization MOdifier) domain protein [Trichinella spiralis]
MTDTEDNKSGQNNSPVYVVEEILNKRICDGKVQYYLKWKDFSSADCTWEPAENLHCPELIEAFEKSLKNENSSSEQMNDSPVKPIERRFFSEVPRRNIQRASASLSMPIADPIGIPLKILNSLVFGMENQQDMASKGQKSEPSRPEAVKIVKQRLARQGAMTEDGKYVRIKVGRFHSTKMKDIDRCSIHVVHRISIGRRFVDKEMEQLNALSNSQNNAACPPILPQPEMISFSNNDFGNLPDILTLLKGRKFCWRGRLALTNIYCLGNMILLVGSENIVDRYLYAPDNAAVEITIKSGLDLANMPAEPKLWVGQRQFMFLLFFVVSNETSDGQKGRDEKKFSEIQNFLKGRRCAGVAELKLQGVTENSTLEPNVRMFLIPPGEVFLDILTRIRPEYSFLMRYADHIMLAALNLSKLEFYGLLCLVESCRMEESDCEWRILRDVETSEEQEIFDFYEEEENSRIPDELLRKIYSDGADRNYSELRPLMEFYLALFAWFVSDMIDCNYMLYCIVLHIKFRKDSEQCFTKSLIAEEVFTLTWVSNPIDFNCICNKAHRSYYRTLLDLKADLELLVHVWLSHSRFSDFYCAEASKMFHFITFIFSKEKIAYYQQKLPFMPNICKSELGFSICSKRVEPCKKGKTSRFVHFDNMDSVEIVASTYAMKRKIQQTAPFLEPYVHLSCLKKNCINETKLCVLTYTREIFYDDFSYVEREDDEDCLHLGTQLLCLFAEHKSEVENEFVEPSLAPANDEVYDGDTTSPSSTNQVDSTPEWGTSVDEAMLFYKAFVGSASSAGASKATVNDAQKHAGNIMDELFPDEFSSIIQANKIGINVDLEYVKSLQKEGFNMSFLDDFKDTSCIGNVNVEISNVTDNLQSYAKDKLLVDPSFDQQHGLITTFNGTQENADDELQQTHFLTNMLTLTEEIPSSVDVQDAIQMLQPSTTIDSGEQTRIINVNSSTILFVFRMMMILFQAEEDPDDYDMSVLREFLLFERDFILKMEEWYQDNSISDYLSHFFKCLNIVRRHIKVVNDIRCEYVLGNDATLSGFHPSSECSSVDCSICSSEKCEHGEELSDQSDEEHKEVEDDMLKNGTTCETVHKVETPRLSGEFKKNSDEYMSIEAFRQFRCITEQHRAEIGIYYRPTVADDIRLPKSIHTIYEKRYGDAAERISDREFRMERKFDDGLAESGAKLWPFVPLKF